MSKLRSLSIFLRVRSAANIKKREIKKTNGYIVQ
jgi:hypothetical protein